MDEPFGMARPFDLLASPDILTKPPERIRRFLRRHCAVLALSIFQGITLGATALSLVAWLYQAPIVFNKQHRKLLQQQSAICHPTLETNVAADYKPTCAPYQRLETAKGGLRTFMDRLRPSLIREQLVLDNRAHNLLASLTPSISNEGSGLVKRLFFMTRD